MSAGSTPSNHPFCRPGSWPWVWVVGGLEGGLQCIAHLFADAPLGFPSMICEQAAGGLREARAGRDLIAWFWMEAFTYFLERVLEVKESDMWCGRGTVGLACCSAADFWGLGGGWSNGEKRGGSYLLAVEGKINNELNAV
jgi:hypothetical protein